jgi:hypothetical protein
MAPKALGRNIYQKTTEKSYFDSFCKTALFVNREIVFVTIVLNPWRFEASWKTSRAMISPWIKDIRKHDFAGSKAKLTSSTRMATAMSLKRHQFLYSKQ